MIRYLVTHAPHFIGQRIVEPGEIVTLPEGVKPGRWLIPQAADVSVQAADMYQARHIGGGSWAVENSEDGSRASVVFSKDKGDAKALAQAEAARLNAGGAIILGATDSAPSSAQDDAPAGTTNPGELPDA